jgi:hypothetical protein
MLQADVFAVLFMNELDITGFFFRMITQVKAEVLRSTKSLYDVSPEIPIFIKL